MTVYVDRLRQYPDQWYNNTHAAKTGARNGHQWCHMWADTPHELHEFARRIGLKRQWAQSNRARFLHYDLTPGRRNAAIKLGATQKELIEP